jgi:hypothetical protein
MSANTRRFAEDFEKTEFIKLDSPGECTESVYEQVPKNLQLPNWLDTAELLSVTPMRRSCRFLTGPILMCREADLLPQKIGVSLALSNGSFCPAMIFLAAQVSPKFA